MTRISTSPAPPPRRAGLPRRLLALHDAAFRNIEAALAGWLVPTLARFAFAAVLLVYFWASATTKLGAGPLGVLHPSPGAFAQIFPVRAEALLYDPARFSLPETLVVLTGTWAEFLLPLLIVIGLFTRVAALGMIGFVLVQSLTDIFGHMADAETVGAWFDRASDAPILDQRTFWVFVLIVLVLRGAGPLSVDRWLGIGRSGAAR